MNEPLIILGASARAAAYSAVRAGFSPVAVDLFGDEDLRAVAPVQVAEDYPHGLFRALETLPAAPLMYTGGLENEPDLLASLPERFELWGNGPDVLRRVRDPFEVARLLTEAGLPALRVERELPAGSSGEWLRKSRRSSAGLRVRRVDLSRPLSLSADDYLQEYKPGDSLAAVFLSTEQGTQCLGVTRQWIGLSPAVGEFVYCGSLGPMRLDPDLIDQVQRLGEALATTGLRGLWGADLIRADGQIWLCEINPRYTASMELLEFAGRGPLLAGHRSAFTGEHWQPEPLAATGLFAKMIVYAEQDLTAPDWRGWIPPDTLSLPWLADIPAPGLEIRRGQPVCTIYTSGDSLAACRESWENRVRESNFPAGFARILLARFPVNR